MLRRNSRRNGCSGSERHRRVHDGSDRLDGDAAVRVRLDAAEVGGLSQARAVGTDRKELRAPRVSADGVAGRDETDEQRLRILHHPLEVARKARTSSRATGPLETVVHVRELTEVATEIVD